MKKRNFISNMSRREMIFALIYLPIHTIILPLIMNWHSYMYAGMFSATDYNVVYIIFSFIAVLAVCKNFLRADYDILLDNKWQNFMTFVRAYFLSFVLGYVMLLIIFTMVGDLTSWINPNDEAVYELADEDFYKVLCFSVFLAPMVEEVLFRGAVFGLIRKKSRFLAYAVSVLLFAVLHVWQYAVALDSTALLVYILDYIPAGIVLAWSYERSGTIWLPIFFHMGTNMMALSLVGYI